MKTFKFNRNAMVQAEGCTNARQKIGVNPRTTSTIGRFASVLCIILIMLLTLGVGQMWGYTILRCGELYGSGDWSNSDVMTRIGSTNVYYKTYNSPTATTDLFFRIGTGSGWTTEKDNSGIDNLNSNIVMVATSAHDNSIKFQVPTSVPVTIYYNSSTKKIWIKVDSYKTDVLNGKEMFYYGFTTNWGEEFAHFFDNNTRKFGNYAAASYADKSAKLAIGVYDVNGSTNYSASNNSEWAGVTHAGMAAGCQIQTYNDGSNKCYYNAASTFSFGTTAFTIVTGQTIASFPTISFTSKTSGVGSSLSLEGYYYSTATSGETWTAFTPGTTESSLAAGTYYIKAIATDSAIYMASTNYITLTVNSAPVLGVANATSVTSNSATFNATATLNSNTTSSYGFKYGAGASYDTKAELISGGTSASTTGALDGTTFSKEVTGLSASTTYYYISYAVVNGTTYYSDAVKSFTTSAAATYNLSVVAGTGISAVTGSTNNISASQNIDITATVATGYTWNTWTKTGTGTLSTFTAGTKNQTITIGTVGDITLTASATENKHNVTVQYRCGTAVIKSNTTASNVGEVTPSSQAAPAIDGYTFSTWTIESGVTKTSGNLTDATLYFKTNSSGTYTITATYTANACNLTKLSAAKDGSENDKGAMTFDETTKAYYKDVTTDAGPYYFRFTYNSSTKYCSDWKDSNYDSGKAVGANTSESKVACDQDVSEWTNKPAMYFPGTNGAKIRIWFDYHNKKVWTTASLNEQYVLRGANADDSSQADGMPGWGATTSYFDGLASGNTGTISCTLNASEWYHLKVVDMFSDTWYGRDADAALSNGVLTSTSSSGDDFYFQSTVAGSYTFTLDKSSGIKIKVDYPASYTLTYAIGDVAGNDGDISSDPSTDSGSYVPSGNTVTLTAPDAADGYTWKGWYSNAAGTSAQLETDQEYEVTVTANTTVYACYTEDMHTVTIAADGTGGSITSPAGLTKTESAGISTESGTITATPTNAAWRFWFWDIPDGVALADGYENTNATIKINATADSKTITAYFQPRFALVGSLDADGDPAGGMPADGSGKTWDNNDAADFEVIGFTALGSGDGKGVDLECERTLLANRRYKFRVVDRSIWETRGCTSDDEMGDDANWQLNQTGEGSHDVHIRTKGAGTYTFKITNLTNDANLYPSLTVERQSSYSVTFGYGTGGTAVTASGSISGSITSGQYVAAGEDVEFTETHTTPGYTFKGWYTSSDGNTTVSGMSTSDNVLDAISGNANVYAQYTEIMTTVDLATTGSGNIQYWDGDSWEDAPSSESVGVHTTCSLKVVPDAGYYFSGWTRSETPDFHLDGYAEANTNVTLTGDGTGTSGTLTANFKELEKIYFRNLSTMDDGSWANVYVYFGVDWNGYENAVSNANAAYKVAMTQIGSSDVYWAYVPRAFTSSSGTAIAFSNQSVSTSTAIYTGLAATRNDYNKALQMYVPSVTWADHGAHYYNDGYWRNYPVKVATGAGYYLQTTRGTNLVEFKGQADNSDKIECTVRVDEHDKDKVFHIKSAGGVYYEPYDYEKEEYPKISSSAPTMTMKGGDTDGLTVTLTSEGIYTFIIDQSSDIMELTVGYPVSIGDYRLKHTYDDGSAKTTYSDVIKSGDAAEGQTISMYLSTAGTESLVLQKCTAIVAGVPAWDAGNDTNLSGVLTTVGTNYGVYQFDVAVSGDQVASAPTATKYTGPYYIKTDGATGGWATYKQNSMDENTLNYDTDHPEKSFNYYYCKYYNYAGTNLKCVIANDYCNALTDTLVGDAVIGIENQTTPSAASVRFSYNTYTNEIKRSYLGASVNSDFLRILGNTAAGKPHIYDKAETTYDDSHADSYITFEDKQNWRYEIDVKADVNARAKLTATFNGQTQYFWGHAGEVGEEWDDENTEELFGGTSGTYGLTLVYDFKTNKLITAWKPTGTINSDLSLKSDIFLLREHQESPTTITFGLKDESNYASLTDVKTVYSVLRLNRWKLNNRAHPEDLDTDHCDGGESDYTTYHAELEVDQDGWLPQAERELYFISFPFDVKMSDIISFGNYYDTWGIMYYDGKGRAKSGYWVDSESNWKYFTPEEFATETLNAYEGYLIGIDLSAMAYNNTSFWTNNSSEVDIYFPSKTAVSTITQKAVTVTIDTVGYKCSINRDFGGSDGDRRIKDSHWHCIGVPSYADLTHAINNGAPADASWSNTSLLYLYEWDSSKNEHSIKKSSEFNFKAMYAYLVQYAGTTLTWAASSATGPTSIVARRMKTEELRDRQFNLQLMQSGKEADHTYIRLSDDEEVTTGFEFNHDVSKMMLSGANIYTLIGKEQAAANSLPLNLEQTTVVPVGVKIATNGDYTFSISEGTQGVGVTLIDNETGTRTSLSALDYEISLEAGTYDERFLLEISPIKNTPTSIEETTGDGLQVTNARKVMIDGLLYIVKDGVIYDARGAVVK